MQARKLKAGLIGCGGRGTGAATQFLKGNDEVEVTALADVFGDKLLTCLDRLRQDPRNTAIASKVNVPAENRFVGFDAYQKLIASDVDIVMLCTPPGYRPMHFEAAINAGKHVFAEKPIATDATGVRRFMAAALKAKEKKLTVVSGAQNRSNSAIRETRAKVQAGAIGDIVAAYVGYYSGPVMHAKERDPKWGDMEWQHRDWYSYLWLCGDQIVEQHFHNIDLINWFVGMHPVKVVASGGAAWRPRTELYGNIYDHLRSEFTYPNGLKLISECRQYPKGCYYKVYELLVGSKGRSDCRDMGGKPAVNPQIQEHVNLVNSVRGTGPYINHGQEVAESTLTCIMAREAAYSGLEITWDMILNSKQDLMPKTFGYDVRMTAPPLPVPGEYKFI
jgi:predicted dehydrogenase